MKGKHHGKGNKYVPLPKVPVGAKVSTSEDEFWMQQGTSGAINAFRQLSHTLHRGGRRTAALPGGKLQPLFKNNETPNKRQATMAQKHVLPNIDGVSPARRLLSGQLEDLPESLPTSVKIYLCSNYIDMTEERNALMKHAMPKLESFCSEHGLLLHVVDLYWGMSPTDNAPRPIRTCEIKECQRLSLGPNFVLLHGDHYGKRLPPPQLSQEVYEALEKLCEGEDLEPLQDLNTHYKLRGNVFMFQESQEDGKDMGGVGMVGLLEEAIRRNIVDHGQIDDTYISALEEDIQHGILQTQSPRKHCLCYRREFQNINKDSQSAAASTYLNVVEQPDGKLQFQEDLYKRNQKLVQEVVQHLGVGNCKQYFLQWDDEALLQNQEDGKLYKEFQAYLDKLCEDFVSDMKSLILLHLDSGKKNSSRTQEMQIQEEALFHLQMCQNKYKNFYGQKDVLTDVERFLRDPRRSHRPCVLYGASGVGKSSVMSAVAYGIQDWFPTESVLVTRFLGTTDTTSNILDLVVSITLQIAAAYSLKIPKVSESCSTLFDALNSFRSMLDEVSAEHAFAHPLFILLDGLDQVYPHDDALKALWAIREFPPNIHLIISTVPTVGSVNLLGALVSMVTTPDAAFEVPFPDEGIVAHMVNSLPEAQKQSVDEGSLIKLTERYRVKPNPLLLELKIANLNPAHEMDNEIRLSFDHEDIKSYLLDEYDFDDISSRSFFSYITAATIGVHERELLELLKFSQTTMEQVYEDKGPAPAGVLGFPAGQLAFFKNSTSSLLEEHMLYGKTVLAWKHSDIYQGFGEILEIIYQGRDTSDIAEEDLDANYSLMIHEHFSNLYLNQNKSNLLSEPMPTPNNGGKSEFQVALLPQPTTSVNLQKLNRLIHHMKVLVPLEGLDRLKGQMLFNFSWLTAKLASSSVTRVVQDIVIFLTLTRQLYQDGIFSSPDTWQDIAVLVEFLQLAAKALAKKNTYLASEIVARLSSLSNDSPWIKSLVTEAADHSTNHDDGVLTPVHSCLTTPGSELRHTMRGPTHVIGFLPGSQTAIMFNKNIGVEIWRVETGELLQRFPANREQAIRGIIPIPAAECVIIGHYSHLNHVMDIGVWSADTGIKVISATYDQKFEAFSLNSENDCLYVAFSKVSTDLVDGESSRRYVWGINVQTKDVSVSIDVVDIHDDGISQLLPLTKADEGKVLLISVGSFRAKDLGIWDVVQQSLIHKVELGYHPSNVCINNELMSAVCCSFQDGAILFVDLSEGRISHSIDDHRLKEFIDVCVSWKLNAVYVATHKAGIIQYSLSDGKEGEAITDLYTSSSETKQLASKIHIDEEGKWIFAGHESGDIALYRASDHRLVHQLHGHSARVNTLSYLFQRILSGSDDETARLWNISSILESEEGDQSEGVKDSTPEKKLTDVDVSMAVLSTDGKYVTTGSSKGPTQVWSTENGVWEREISAGCEGGVAHLYLAYRGRLMVGHCHCPSTPRTLQLQVWKAETGDLMKLDDGPHFVYTSCAMPSDDKLLVIGPSPENRQLGIVLKILDLFELKCVASLFCNIYGSMDCTNLSLLGFTQDSLPDNTELLSVTEGSRQNSQVGNGDGDRAEDLPVQNMCAVLDYYPQPDQSFLFTFFLHGQNSDKIAMDHHEPIHLDSVSPACSAVILGCQCITGTTDGALVLWNVITQKITKHFVDGKLQRAVRAGELSGIRVSGRPAHCGAVTCVTVHHDTRLLSGGVDGIVKIWDLQEKALIQLIEGYSAKVLSLHMFGADQVVCGSADSTVCVWNTESGKQLASFFCHGDPTGITVNPTANRVVVTVKDKKTRLMILKMPSQK